MGGRGSSSGKASGSAGANASGLRNGETVYAKLAPSQLYPDGQPMIASTKDGGYRYVGELPSWDSIDVDKGSEGYVQAKKDYNIYVRVYPDGKVEVSKGGLYSRDKTYKDIESFKKDVNKRIDSRSMIAERERQSLMQGRISQIQAEYLRGVIRKNSNAQASSKVRNSIINNMENVKSELYVAQMARNAANNIEDRIKKTNRG